MACETKIKERTYSVEDLAERWVSRWASRNKRLTTLRYGCLLGNGELKNESELKHHSHARTVQSLPEGPGLIAVFGRESRPKTGLVIEIPEGPGLMRVFGRESRPKTS